jgi:large subunit ribosomal protein L13
MKTVSTRPQDVDHSWFVVDAENKTLGRLATEVALRLRGKHKPEYTPHVDTGDYIVVVNADKIRVTVKEMNFKDMQDRHPERILEKAVKGMLPKNPLGRAMFKKLKVYAGAEHPHAAQQPQPLEI